MGKGKELATEANHRLDNFQTQLVDVLKLINTDMEALKNEVKANFDEKLNELEDRLTKKFEDNLSSLEKDFDKVITDMDSKIEDITQALPFMEIKIEDAQTKLKNSQRAGLTLVRDLEDKHKTKENKSKRMIAALRRNLSRSKKAMRLEVGKMKMKIKVHVKWYKFELQKLRRTTEVLQTSNESLKLDKLSTIEALENLKEELRKYSSVDMALLKANISSNQGKLIKLEKDQEEAIELKEISKRITKLETKKPTRHELSIKVSRLYDDVNMLKDSIECFYCRYCGNTFNTTFGLKTHLKSKHNKLPTE